VDITLNTEAIRAADKLCRGDVFGDLRKQISITKTLAGKRGREKKKKPDRTDIKGVEISLAGVLVYTRRATAVVPGE